MFAQEGPILLGGILVCKLSHFLMPALTWYGQEEYGVVRNQMGTSSLLLSLSSQLLGSSLMK